MSSPFPPSLLDILRKLAPGTELRNAVELIMRQQTGGLIVLGWGPEVEAVCSGGFVLSQTPFTAQRLAELAKMDGAIVVDDEIQRVVRANVHLLPDPSIPTKETGTRFRTAERLAVQTSKPVLSISEARALAIVFTGEGQHELESPETLLPRANQTILTLERFRRRLDDTEALLTRLEVEDNVTVRVVVSFIQRAELVRRIGADLERLTVALGGEGRLIRLQATDLLQGVTERGDTVIADYSRLRRKGKARSLATLREIPTEQLFDAEEVADALALGVPDAQVRPRGLRILGGIPRFPDSVKQALIAHFGDLQKMMRSSVEELNEVEGVGKARAHQLRSYLDHLAGPVPAWGPERKS